MSVKLTSIPTLVQSPFIVVTIGGVTFGTYTGNRLRGKVTYPNFMKGMNIEKVNGTVNRYSIRFEYQVRVGDDPNLLDKIFSRATKDRKIKIEYGDWNSPSYIYKEEIAIITGITSNLNLSQSSIDYTVSCTSDAIGLHSTTFNFPARDAKPSDVLMSLLQNSRYGLRDVFTGMRDTSDVIKYHLIATNDKKVSLLAQTNVTVLDYMNYLVDSMIDSSVIDDRDKPSKYYLTIHDDYSNELGGTYFKVSEVSKSTNTVHSTDTYEIDVNYPTDNFVTNFTVNNNQSWAILYEFNDKIKQEEYTYKIDDEGNLVTDYSPALTKSYSTNLISPSKSNWWRVMTEFPIEATLTIKGLTRPSILMTYVKLNVLFAGGLKHISSGTYIITKQVDDIDASGYRTTLTLLRVQGDT